MGPTMESHSSEESGDFEFILDPVGEDLIMKGLMAAWDTA